MFGKTDIWYIVCLWCIWINYIWVTFFMQITVLRLELFNSCPVFTVYWQFRYICCGRRTAGPLYSGENDTEISWGRHYMWPSIWCELVMCVKNVLWLISRWNGRCIMWYNFFLKLCYRLYAKLIHWSIKSLPDIGIWSYLSMYKY